MSQPKPDFRLAGGIAVALLVVLGIVGYSLGAWTAIKDRFMTQPAEVVAETESSPVEPPHGVAVVTTGSESTESAANRETEQDAGSEEPQKTQQVTAETAEPDPVDPLTPELDIVRVEPTGETLVAGRSVPGAIIAIISNGEVRGKGVANESGEWAVIVERPLEPGSHDMLISAKMAEEEKEVVSDERVAVHIPETASEDVLVVVNREGAPSEILQLPQTAESARESSPKEEKVASLDSGSSTQVSTGDKVAASEGTGDNQDTAAAPTTGNSSEEADKNANSIQAANTADASAEKEQTGAGQSTDQTSKAAQGSETTRSADIAVSDDAAKQNQTDASQTGSQQQVAKLGSAEIKSDGVVGDAASEESKTEDVSTRVPDTNEAIQTGSYSVAVSAVETEKGKLFVAGEGTAGERVQIYLGEDLVGSVTSGGNSRWLLEAQKDVSPGTHEVRADVVDQQSGKVLARAVVNFKKVPDSVILRPVVSAEQAEGSGAGGASAEINVAQLPNVIIRKGDNLWTISRRLYGDGLRYTTIYQANKDQIRDPDLIFPGQVFMTPERDLNWKN